MSEKWKFTAEDFAPHGLCEFVKSTWAIERSNELIRKWIADSPVVTGVIQKDQSISVSEWDEWAPGIEPHKNDTHRGRLIIIEPIVKDTAEQFVKDMAGHAKFQYQDDKWAMNAEYWVDRARKLLEGK